MAISSYTSLKAAVADWLDRTDLTDSIPDFIGLAEIRHRRDFKIRSLETRVTANTVAGQEYYNLPAENDYWSGSSTDFFCRFPDGYTLAPGSSIKISLRNSSAYESVYGQTPDISLDDDMLSVSEVADTKGNPGAPKLHNSSETLILFYWDGSSDIVKDVDYLIWGDNSFAIDKSGVDGYLSDTPSSSQSYMPVHATNEKLVRLDKSSEGGEIVANGNGCLLYTSPSPRD